MILRRREHIEKYETAGVHKDGHPIDASVTISPVKSKNGIVVGASGVARDITEQRQTQQALRRVKNVFAQKCACCGLQSRSAIALHVDQFALPISPRRGPSVPD
jgi:hypothetical protein